MCQSMSVTRVEASQVMWRRLGKVYSPLFDQTPPLMWQGLRAKTGFGKVHGWALADSRDTDVYISAMSPSTKGGLYYTKLKYKYRKVLFTGSTRGACTTLKYRQVLATGSTRGACTTLKYKPPSTDKYLSSSTDAQGLVRHSRRHVPRASKAQDAQIGCEVQICWQQSSPKYLLHYNWWSSLFCTALYMMCSIC